MRRRTLTSKRIRCGSQTAKKLTTYDKYWRIVGGVSIGLTSMLGVMMICPMVSSSTNALDNTTRSANTTVTVDAAATLAVSLDPKVEMEISPDSAGTFSYGTAKLGVMTNNPTGYSIYMQTADGKSTLNNDKVTGGQVINSITANTVGSSFTGNTWGYTLDTNTVTEASTYKPVPTSSDTAIKSTAASTNTDSYNLGFGAHIDNTLASGTYYNDVLVSVVANPKVISSLSDLSFMQDMNSEICANTAEGYTKQLIDTRDSKSYWVSKLKDGNCWMTQNLALDITTEGLKASDTDITADWNSSSEYPPEVTQTSVPDTVSGLTATSVLSWNLGQWVLGTPAEAISCGEQISDMVACKEVNLVQIDDSWSPTFQAQNGTWTGEGNSAGQIAYITADLANKTYDSHYLIGNYYNLEALTAGHANQYDNTSDSGSICPKGWRLPSAAGYHGVDKEGSSFYPLVSAYGMASDTLTGNVDGAEYDIAKAPLYFVRGGEIDDRYSGGVTLQYLSTVGQNGVYGTWQGTTTSDSSHSAWIFDNHGITYSAIKRTSGATARCLAR